MKFNSTKKLVTFFITAVILLNPLQLKAQDKADGGVFDESLQDLTLVLGAGLGGAILGLSTLSFADKPKDHTKNIAIGGAVGIVIGVGIVIFGQASKSQSIVTDAPAQLMNPETSESLARNEFSKQRIAANYELPTTIGYNFSF